MKYPKMTKEHAYLGHFKGCLADGHNSDPMPPEKSTMDKIIQQIKDIDLWKTANPQGTGNTKRGFNDIYPKPGK